ncbi:MAG: DUF3592 domain-containing protein [Verrucomicrobiota bacterium]|nr:DUF3592 domain-containing protein [Verrucomicrobiota bacterium]
MNESLRVKRRAPLQGSIFLILFGLIWTGVTAGLDYNFGRNIFKQIQAHSFPTTQGKIIHVALEKRNARKSETYIPVIRFAYEVNGRSYTSEKFRFDHGPSSSRSYSRRIVAENPKDSTALVYYNPNNPGEGILYPGIDGSDLFVLMFMLPFNLIAFGILFALVGSFIRKDRNEETGGIPAASVGHDLYVNLSTLGPGMTTLIYFGFATLGTLFAVAVLSGIYPSTRAGVIGWIFILTSSLAMYVRQRYRFRNFLDHLLIQRQKGSIRLPLSYGRKKLVSIPLPAVQQIEMRNEKTRDSRNRENEKWSIHLHHIEQGQERIEKLYEFHDQAKATAFTAWLRFNLGLERNRT